MQFNSILLAATVALASWQQHGVVLARENLGASVATSVAESTAVPPTTTQQQEVVEDTDMAIPVNDTHWTFVIDRSASTGDLTRDGGNPNACGPGINVLECEIIAITALMEVIEDSFTVVDFGFTSYSHPNATTHEFESGGGLYLASPGDPMINETLTSLESGGRTNYAVALEAAYQSLVETEASIKYVVFLSDGKANRPSPAESAFNDALDLVTTISNLTIFSIAIGQDASCTDYLEYGAGTLQEIAQATEGGCCREVDPVDLQLTLLNLGTWVTGVQDLPICPSAAMPPLGGTTLWFSLLVAVVLAWVGFQLH